MKTIFKVHERLNTAVPYHPVFPLFDVSAQEDINILKTHLHVLYGSKIDAHQGREKENVIDTWVYIHL
jgi:hypothetical protein